jgi:hypothetical protein
MGEKVETYPYGITREWQHNKRLVIVQTQGDMSDEAVNEWADLLLKTFSEMPEEGAFFFIDDLSHPNQGITPNAMKRGREVLSATPRTRKQLYFAVVLANSFINRLTAVLMKQFMSWNSNVVYGIFTSREDANKWVMENMQKEGVIEDVGANTL